MRPLDWKSGQMGPIAESGELKLRVRRGGAVGVRRRTLREICFHFGVMYGWRGLRASGLVRLMLVLVWIAVLREGGGIVCLDVPCGWC
jgi:hypothetical protein